MSGERPRHGPSARVCVAPLEEEQHQHHRHDGERLDQDQQRVHEVGVREPDGAEADAERIR